MTISNQTADRRIVETGFAERRSGVQAPAQAYDDNRDAAADAEGRVAALRAVIAGDLL